MIFKITVNEPVVRTQLQYNQLVFNRFGKKSGSSGNNFEKSASVARSRLELPSASWRI
jgi:hypothetical protein